MAVGSKSTVVRVPKAGELVAANLRRRIITGELGAGDPLPNESVLMEQFGVSRPTLREAFRILESESIITVLRGARGGARVMAPDASVAARYTGLLLQYQGTRWSTSIAPAPRSRCPRWGSWRVRGIRSNSIASPN